MNDEPKRINRRDFLKASALTGGLFVAGPLLGCASKKVDREPSAAKPPNPLAFATFYGGYYGEDGTPYPCEYGHSYYQAGYYGYAYVGPAYTYGFFDGHYVCPDANYAAQSRKRRRPRRK